MQGPGRKEGPDERKVLTTESTHLEIVLQAQWDKRFDPNPAHSQCGQHMRLAKVVTRILSSTAAAMGPMDEVRLTTAGWMSQGLWELGPNPLQLSIPSRTNPEQSHIGR